MKVSRRFLAMENILSSRLSDRPRYPALLLWAEHLGLDGDEVLSYHLNVHSSPYKY